MNNELKYIFKGVLYICLLFTCMYIIYYAVSYKQNISKKEQPPVITYDDLMSRPDVSAGKILFENNCAACHKFHSTDEAWTGITLQNNYNKKDLYGWIRNSDSVIKSGNVYYNDLFNEYNKTQMKSFPNLTDNEIDDILNYIKVEKTFANLPTP